MTQIGGDEVCPESGRRGQAEPVAQPTDWDRLSMIVRTDTESVNEYVRPSAAEGDPASARRPIVIKREGRMRSSAIVANMMLVSLVAILLAACGTSACPPGVAGCESGPPVNEQPKDPPVPGEEPGESDPIAGEPKVPAGLQVIYVAPDGYGRDGSRESPMGLRDGLQQAVVNRVNGKGTKVVLLSGTYRTTMMPVWTDDGSAPIVVEAAEPGEAIVTGSDIWTSWECDGPTCTHEWRYDWGVADNPWPDDVDIGSLARRRELVVVNGIILEQVRNEGDLLPGTFFVDESSDKLVVELPEAVSPSDAIFEVGVRHRLLDTLSWPGVMVRGIVFQHTVPEFITAGILVGTGTTLVNVTVRDNGQIGMYAEGDNISIWRSVFNHNGGDGFLLRRIRGLDMISSHSSYNNWRGALGRFDEWGVGQKILRVHGARLINHTAIGNWSRGIWLDWDNEDFVIKGLTACNNRNDGLRIEASQGPVTVTDSVICSNGGFGVSGNGSTHVEFSGNRVEGNRRGALHFEGEERHVGSMDGSDFVLNLEDWFMSDNYIAGADDSTLWTVAFWDLDARSDFFSSSTFDNNRYEQPDNERPFAFLASGSARLTFEQWRSATGQEANSTIVD